MHVQRGSEHGQCAPAPACATACAAQQNVLNCGDDKLQPKTLTPASIDIHLFSCVFNTGAAARSSSAEIVDGAVADAGRTCPWAEIGDHALDVADQICGIVGERSTLGTRGSDANGAAGLWRLDARQVDDVAANAV